MTLRGANLRALLAEDIPAMRMLVRQMLRSLGIEQIIEAIDGSTALHALQENPVDLILSDWNMIPMTGIQLLTAVRADRKLAHIPFIMITGEHSSNYVTRARAAGVDGYLIKPFGMDKLERQIVRALERNRRAA